MFNITNKKLIIFTNMLIQSTGNQWDILVVIKQININGRSIA
mgnify:CR=1 FL=1